jgi:hypothetical protein
LATGLLTLRDVRVCAALLFFAGTLAAQQDFRNRITLSAGWGEQIDVYPPERQTAPVIGFSYGFRALKFLELEAGLSVGLQPGLELCSAHGCFNPNDRYFWVPFGVRFIAPVARKRVELSPGGGGLYENYSVGCTNFNVLPHDGWGGYFVAGAALAIDHSRRFWIGATPRVILANPRYGRDRWFNITGDFSFRF